MYSLHMGVLSEKSRGKTEEKLQAVDSFCHDHIQEKGKTSGSPAADMVYFLKRKKRGDRL